MAGSDNSDAAGRKQQQQSGRHRARRNAMMALYKVDLLDGDVEQAIVDWQREHGFELPAYASAVVRAVTADLDRIDAELQRNLHEWSLDRLGTVERSILRIGMHELLGTEVPDEVAIDQAVELAKRYASPEAAKLVNGVLGGYLSHERAGGTGKEPA